MSRRDDLRGVCAGLSLEDLPGAGPRICARLRAAGLATVASIYAAPSSRVIAAWSSIEGERVRLALRDEDVPARVTQRRSVAHGRVLTGPDRCWREARQIVRWLAVCALHRCTEGRQAPGRVCLEVATHAGGRAWWSGQPRCVRLPSCLSVYMASSITKLRLAQVKMG